MLALALFKYGGYMGFCSPPSFYAATNSADHKQPARADLHEAVNIMQAHQFSAAGIRNFLDVVKAGQLNDAVAAWNRVRSGLGSGDYCMLSLSNGIFGDAAHTVIPYRAEMSGGAYVLHVWNPNVPYAFYPGHYDEDHNKIVITGPTSWHYDQNVPDDIGGAVYDGSNNGWFFAIPTSLERLHKGRQPISAGFVLTGLTTLFVSGVGAAVTRSRTMRAGACTPATACTAAAATSDVACPPTSWPRAMAVARRGRRGPARRALLPRTAGRKLSFERIGARRAIQRPMHLSSGHLTELTAKGGAANAR